MTGNAPRLPILFAGIPRFALELWDAGAELRAIVLPYLDDDDETWALIEQAQRRDVPVLPGHVLTDDAGEEEREALAVAGPYDLVLVMSFDRKLGPWARSLGRKAAWNVHGSLLPRHRGYNPYYWTIRRGDERAGLTVHEMSDVFDAGGILGTRALSVPPGCTSGMLWQMLCDVAVPAVLPLLAGLASGAPVRPVAQDPSLVTRAPEPDGVERTVDVHAPAAHIVRHIRAATPEPGAFLVAGGKRFLVRGAVEGPDSPPGARPGDVFLRDGQAFVTAGQGSFRPLTLEHPAGALALAVELGLRAEEP